MVARTVLIVEDDPSQSEGLGAILEVRGYEALFARTCKDGLRLACEANPLLAILGVKMADGTGSDLLAGIREAVPDCLCIILTPDAEPEPAPQIVNGGAERFLREPIDPHALLALLDLTSEINELRKKNREGAVEIARHRDELEGAVRERTLQLEGANGRLAQKIEERKSIEASLREREEKYRLLAENTADVTWTSGLGLSLNYVSPSIRRLTGYTPEETKALKINEFYAPESIAGCHRCFRRGNGD